MGESLWSVWVLLFSGLDEVPKTPTGRLLAMVLLVAGVGLAAYSRRAWPRFWSNVICGEATCRTSRWTTIWYSATGRRAGLEWIREVHSKIITEPRPIVIIHDNPDEIDLPDKQDEPAFKDVYIVKGDPTNEVILRRAAVAKAYSVVILSDAARRQARRR